MLNLLKYDEKLICPSCGNLMRSGIVYSHLGEEIRYKCISCPLMINPSAENIERYKEGKMIIIPESVKTTA